MTRGDAVGALTSLTNGSTYAIQPSGSLAYSIHNIYFSASCTVSISNGTNSIVFVSPNAAGVLPNLYIEVTNTLYLVITNNSGGTAYYAYEGVQSSP